MSQSFVKIRKTVFEIFSKNPQGGFCPPLPPSQNRVKVTAVGTLIPVIV